MFRRLLYSITLALAVTTLAVDATPAVACPMCKEANETDSKLPTAYLTSILFMLAVPATVLTGFSIGLYRLSRQRGDVELEGDDFSILD